MSASVICLMKRPSLTSTRMDSKFIRANRAAMKILGITPEDVATTYGKNFIPDTPEAQRRLKEVFESIGKGIDTSGVVLRVAPQGWKAVVDPVVVAPGSERQLTRAPCSSTSPNAC